MTVVRTPFDVTHELIAAYDEYVAVLEKAESSLLGLAHAHGHRTPAAIIERGKELREKIAALKTELADY
jgi:hypothetical protein